MLDNNNRELNQDNKPIWLDYEEFRIQYQEFQNEERILDKYLIRGMVEHGEMDITQLDISHITDLSHCFEDLTDFDQDITNWNIENVTTMKDIFKGVEAYSESIKLLDNRDRGPKEWLSKKESLIQYKEFKNGNRELDKYIIRGMAERHKDLSDLDTSHITDLSYCFEDLTDFSKPLQLIFQPSLNSPFQDISKWNVSNVTNMEGMFKNANNFYQYISSWDVSNVKNIDYMFSETTTFAENLIALRKKLSCDSSQMFGDNKSLDDYLVINYQNIIDELKDKVELTCNLREKYSTYAKMIEFKSLKQDFDMEMPS